MEVPTIDFVYNYTVCYIPGLSTPWGTSPDSGFVRDKRDIIKDYATLLNVEETEEAIKQRAPCSWIQKVVSWVASDSYVAHLLNLYISDDMMYILLKHREGKLTKEMQETIDSINEIIYRSPRIDVPTRVYRGTSGVTPIVGTKITLNTPKSGTFTFEVADFGYVEGDCCILLIHIPAGAIMSYHASEDQVIFPQGANFYIVAGPYDRNIYHAIYTGINDDTIRSKEEYLSLVINNSPFPY